MTKKINKKVLPKEFESFITVNRRTLFKSAAIGYVGLALPGELSGLYAASSKKPAISSSAASELMQDLLKQWCDGMLKVQVDNPEDPTVHGLLRCPSCNVVHGRCMDAVYPFFYMAHKTGQQKYLDAGIKAFEWSKNVTLPSGGWTVIPDPTSWSGITVFGAIALAETLHYHGSILDENRRKLWYERLRKAGDFLVGMFDNIAASNINYGCTTTYAMSLLGKVLDNPEYTKHGRKLAAQFKDYLTQPNLLIYGEGKPVEERSPKGLLPVDLGYNVEESLNGIAMYALAEKDEELIELVVRSMSSHLEFMLPDGGWDNSWGTREFKWTYWGSRTSDGCQPAYALMRHKNPAFATAVYQNTLLMQQCTQDGLLHGGPHYISHGVKPCVHHTFTHAKALAAVLDHEGADFKMDCSAVLPRMAAQGVGHFADLDTWLVAKGPWRATVTAYDRLYKKNIFHPTGGAIGMLWHKKAGPVLASSLARYFPVESYNMQPNPDGVDIPLTVRVEATEDGVWFATLYDVKAEVKCTEKKDTVEFEVKTRLLSEDGKSPKAGPAECTIRYQFAADAITIGMKTAFSEPQKIKMAMVVPVISPTGEKVTVVSNKKIEIKKPDTKVAVSASQPLRIMDMKQERIINLVPGFEAVPIVVEVAAGNIECQISCL